MDNTRRLHNGASGSINPSDKGPGTFLLVEVEEDAGSKAIYGYGTLLMDDKLIEPVNVATMRAKKSCS